jgi:hypothetical protein
MNETTTPAPGRQPGQMEASPAPGLPDAMMAYADVARAVLWSVEGARAMFELNYTLLSLGGEVARRQQEAMILAVQRAFQAPSVPDHTAGGDAYTEFARLGFEAFERMAAAMRAANDPARWSRMDMPGLSGSLGRAR